MCRPGTRPHTSPGCRLAQILGDLRLNIHQILPAPKIQGDLLLVVGRRLGRADQIPQPDVNVLQQFGQLGRLPRRQAFGQFGGFERMQRRLHVGVVAPVEFEVQRRLMREPFVGLGLQRAFLLRLARPQPGQTFGNLVAGPEQQDGAPQADRIADTQNPQLNGLAVHLGPVRAFEIGQDQPIVVLLDLDVKTAHTFVVQLDRVALFASNRHRGLQGCRILCPDPTRPVLVASPTASKTARIRLQKTNGWRLLASHSCTLDALIASRSFPGQAPGRESAHRRGKKGTAAELSRPRPVLRIGSLRAPVAQLDSASVFGTEGWRFESLPGVPFFYGVGAHLVTKNDAGWTAFCAVHFHSGLVLSNG